MRACVKFTFANKIEAMHERSLVSVKVEPRSTFRLSLALFILPLLFLRDLNLRALTCVAKNASVEINLEGGSLLSRNSYMYRRTHQTSKLAFVQLSRLRASSLKVDFQSRVFGTHANAGKFYLNHVNEIEVR